MMVNKCTDYVQLYVDLERPEVSESQPASVVLCGHLANLPQTMFFSSTRSLILEFHTDSRQTNHTGFRGVFRFLEKVQFDIQGGTRRWDTPCTYDFYSLANSTKSKLGRLFSPKFPQNYPPMLSCFYQFYGLPGERVHIQFTTIDLEPTDVRCVVKRDVVTVRDGSDSNAAVLARFCGRSHQTPSSIFSFTDSLLIEFSSDKAVERQGFAATFQFVTSSAHLPSELSSASKLRYDVASTSLGSPSTKPVHMFDLNTHNPRDSPMIHIPDVPRTSPETPKPYVCNELHANDGKSPHKTGEHGVFFGTVTSPFYPKPYGPDIDCTYRFQGERHERVRLTFVVFDLGDFNDTPPFCEGFDMLTVTVTLDGIRRDIGVYCGKKIHTSFMSTDNVLEASFVSRPSSGINAPASAESPPLGFKAVYSFVTDFGIQSGEQQRNVNGTYVCRFVYKSSKSLNGTFTSPNFPGLYPRNTECHYLFIGEEMHQVVINFRQFDVEGLPPNCRDEDDSDYVEFSNFNVQLPDRKMAKLCNPVSDRTKNIVSDGSFFRVTFKSNEIYDGIGFEASYQFQKPDFTYASERVLSLNSAQHRQLPSITWTVFCVYLLVPECRQRWHPF